MDLTTLQTLFVDGVWLLDTEYAVPLGEPVIPVCLVIFYVIIETGGRTNGHQSLFEWPQILIGRFANRKRYFPLAFGIPLNRR